MKNGKTGCPIVVVACLVLLLAAPAFGAGADYPRKPIKLYVAAGIGGGEDTEARAIAPFAEKQLGVSVQVENQPGAGGKILFEKFQRMEPDGYSLMVYTFPKSVIIEHLDKVGFRTKDWTPIFVWSKGNQVLVVHADAWKTFDEFLKAAKAKTLSAGLPGRGTTTHLAGLIAVDELGIKVNWVPYEGSAGGLAALAGKHLDCTMCLTVSVGPLTKAGKIRPLLVFSDKRDPYLPDVPIPKDLGFRMSVLSPLRGITAPPHTPPHIVKVLEDAFGRAVKDPAYMKIAQDRQIVISPMNHEEFARLIPAAYPQVDKYKGVLRE